MMLRGAKGNTMDENISQSPGKFEQFLRYDLIITGILGVCFDVWWFLDAQSNNYLNGVLIGLTVVSLLSNIGFCLPKVGRIPLLFVVVGQNTQQKKDERNNIEKKAGT